MFVCVLEFPYKDMCVMFMYQIEGPKIELLFHNSLGFRLYNLGLCGTLQY